MELQNLPLPMSSDNLRRVIDSFRQLRGAHIQVRPSRVEVLDPKGRIVFCAYRRSDNLWSGQSAPGLVNATFKVGADHARP